MAQSVAAQKNIGLKTKVLFDHNLTFSDIFFPIIFRKFPKTGVFATFCLSSPR